jgi:renalase
MSHLYLKTLADDAKYWYRRFMQTTLKQKIAIIGAGIAGISCANTLVAAGQTIMLFDKARGPGGRMSTRRIATDMGEASFDHGAPFFTVQDANFAAIVANWHSLGLVARWPQAGADAWVGVPAMNAPLKHMAQAHIVHWSAKVEALTRSADGWQLQGQDLTDDCFDQVVVAVPAEQAASLLEPFDAAMARKATTTPSKPCWTVMLAFAQPLPTAHKTLANRGVIGWAGCHASKAGRTGPETWVVHANATWSATYLEADTKWVNQVLMAELAECLNVPLPEPLCAAAHRWRYAHAGAEGSAKLFNAALGLGVCGDWLIGPNVEAAWLSGAQLGKIITEHICTPAV